MSDTLRSRIAAVIDREVDGLWEPTAVADAVIRELQLTVLGDGIVVGAIVGADDVLKTSKRQVMRMGVANE